MGGIDTSGVFITTGMPGTRIAVPPDMWDTLVAQIPDAELVPDGVVICSGDKILVISLTEANLPWSSASVIAGGEDTETLHQAIMDWSGEENTTTQVTHEECSGESYAPGYSANFSQNSELAAGLWWLPSLGEMMMIYANVDKINYALSQIEGAKLLDKNGLYWTSTEHGSGYAWFLNFMAGNPGYGSKKSDQYYVRPVSAFRADSL